MNENDNCDAQPLRELEWLVQYFKEHCREDLAEEIFRQIKTVRHQAQNSLQNEASDIIDQRQEQTKKIGELD